MASGQIIDIDALLQPIAGDNPAGPDIREDVSPSSRYYQLKDARSAARASERSATLDDDTGPLLSEWRLVLDLAPRMLVENSKDLEVTAWYIEALVRAYGFAGLRDGFTLARRLVEDFWDNLYPLPDDDGIETRVAPFSGLNGEGGDGTLILPIRKIPLSEGEPLFAAWQYEQANEVAQIADEERRQRRIDDGAMTLDAVEASLGQCRPSFFADLLSDCEEAIAAFAALSGAFDAAAGHDAPPASNIRNRLNTIRGIITTISAGRMPAAAAEEPEETTVTETVSETGETVVVTRGPAVPTGAIVTREDAFKALSKVAEYFRKHEPQAPTAYVLENLIRRGQLTFEDLMAELVDDAEMRKRLMTTAGMQPPKDEGY